MTTLSETATSYIYDTLITAKLAGIENIIFDTEMRNVRAMKEPNIVLIEGDNFPDDMKNVPSLMIADVNKLVSRMDLIRGFTGFKTSYEEDPSKNYVRQLKFATGRTKVEFRCANPTTFRIPKKFVDIIITEVNIPAESIALLQQGISAFGANTVMLSNTDDIKQVTTTLIDSNGDTMQHTAGLVLMDTDTKFAHTYDVKLLVSLTKQNTSTNIKVGQRGSLQLKVNNYSFYVFPQV